MGGDDNDAQAKSLIDGYYTQMLQLGTELDAQVLPKLKTLVEMLPLIPSEEISDLYLTEIKKRARIGKEKELKPSPKENKKSGSGGNPKQ